MPDDSAIGSQFQTISSREVRIGVTLLAPIYDEREILLLSRGKEITAEFMNHLKLRNIDRLRVHESDMAFMLAGQPQGAAAFGVQRDFEVTCSEQNEGTSSLDALLAVPENLALPPQEAAFAAGVAVPPRTGYSKDLRQEMLERQVHSVRQINGVFNGLLAGAALDSDTLCSITDDVLKHLGDDCDVFASLGLNPFGDSYPGRHCLHSAMLAVSIGKNLNLDRTTLKELAIGCLVHDAGMLKIDQKVIQQPRRLTRIEFLEIAKHPVRIFDLLRSAKGVPQRSAFIAYQVHERNDGSGYPRGRVGNQIHTMSKLAAVADIYTAMVTPRCYRPALLPYRAIEQVVDMANRGKLDAAAVRALLQMTSMYPIGSYVLLSDNRVARTIRANGSDFISPVVEAWKRDNLDAPPELIDLAQTPGIVIDRAIPRLDCTDEELGKDTNAKIEPKVVQLIQLVELSEGCGEPEVAAPRKTSRTKVREMVTVYSKNDDGQNGWKTHEFVSRTVSKSGLAMVGQVSDLPSTVVVALRNGSQEPFYLRSSVVQKTAMRDGWYDYSLSFLSKTTAPVNGREPADEPAGSDDSPAVDFTFDIRDLPLPTNDLREFVRNLAETKYSGAQKRRSERFRITIEVPAIALDDHLRPVGDPFIALSYDISTSGIRLFHSRPVPTPFLLVQLANLSGQRGKVVVHVLRCRPLKRFFDVAGKFLTRNDDPRTSTKHV